MNFSAIDCSGVRLHDETGAPFPPVNDFLAILELS
jgi:hypothetical protein